MAKRHTDKQSPYLSPHEASLYLRVSERTLEYYRTYGDGPLYRKHGHRIFYHMAELDAWSKARRFQSTGGATPTSAPSPNGRGLP